MSDALHYQSIAELSTALQARRISAVDLMQAVIARTRAVEDRVHAFNSYDVEDALARLVVFRGVGHVLDHERHRLRQRR